jgi:predicted Zn-dependent protease
MSQSRIEAFEAMLKDQPDEVMIWYGLGNEYFKLERWADAANALRHVVRLNPDYTAAYQMLGSALMGAGLADEARSAWTQGIEAGKRTGAWKAQQHMEHLLAESGAADSADFCK